MSRLGIFGVDWKVVGLSGAFGERYGARWAGSGARRGGSGCFASFELEWMRVELDVQKQEEEL